MDEVRNSVLLVGANRAEFPVHEELMSLLERFVKTGEVVPESMLILSPPVVGGGVDATMTSHQALFDFGLTECLGGWWMIPSMLHVFLGPEVTLSQAVHVGCRIGVGVECIVWELIDGEWVGTELTGSGGAHSYRFCHNWHEPPLRIIMDHLGPHDPPASAVSFDPLEPGRDTVIRLGHTMHSAVTYFWGAIRRSVHTSVQLELTTSQTFAFALGRNRIQADPEIHMDGIRFW